MNPLTTSIALLALMMVSSCGKRDTKSHLEVMNADLVVVAHDRSGNLKDFLVVDDIDSVTNIEVVPPDGETEIMVSVFGKRKHESLADRYVGTKIAEGFAGAIDINFQDGEAIQILGNEVGAPSPLTDEALQKIEDGIKDQQLLPADSSIIHVTRSLEEVSSTEDQQTETP